MCGIGGFLSGTAESPAKLREISAAMNVCLQHRGPDDQGIWIDAEAGIALAHRRLSIVDLSQEGHQPMLSHDGRYVICFNGEVYNFRDIRADLEKRGRTFRGHSDTEVVIEAVAEFGIAQTVPRLIGMFAIAIWDRQDRTLTLVRDRLGIKPLYWTRIGKQFLFASELKGLHQHPDFKPRIDQAAVAAYLRHSYVPAPHTIYEDVFKLAPGTILTVPWQGEPQIATYWDARTAARAGLSEPLAGSDAELTDGLERLLQDAVQRRMIADVPLGAFLSGGVDSSTVVALMRTANMGKVKTFTISFDDADFNEAHHAAAIARHLGTEHTELPVTGQQALDVIPHLPDYYDEPFANSSQIPTYLISAMTRRHVTVALSGDGGDELFAGYNRHQFAHGTWRALSLLPGPVRHGIARSMTAISPAAWDRFAARLPARMRMPQIGDKAHKLASLIGAEDDTALYRRLVSQWEPAELMPGVAEAKGVLWDPAVGEQFPNLVDRMQFLDLVTYLPDDILTKVDRASMAVALEVRVPNHRPPRRRICVAAAAALQDPQRHEQMALAPGALPARAGRTDRTPENGLWRSARRLAAGPAARVGRVAS